jgi:hypothetical protein
MAKCPKCGGHLRIIDWKPNCPHCGVNITYYGLEEELQREADAAEVEHAKVQKRIDRLKTSFVGSPLTIVRIFLSVIPLGMLMLPLATVNYCGPFIEQTSSNINAVTLYNLVSSMDFDSLFTMMNSTVLGKGFTGYFVALGCTLLSVVMVLISLIALMGAMGKLGNIRNITNNCITIGLAVAAIVGFNMFAGNINSVFPEYFSGSVMYGAYAYVASLVVLLAINILLTVKKVEVKYKQCYVGGIPVEEYEEELAKGTSIEELHERMDVILAEKAKIRQEEAAKKAAEKEAEEEKEMARKAGKLK